ncbi:type I secretion system permease/ATPase [Pasteurellaceae bacterium HPA106]|uniref:type I secretion system permease/ATPase n=1 Tax=Spirabiliibacterium pneumoniae TaxID=221400 RepID=UPI001AAC91CC|nr:type I secretion system permease/ATPase [Spirabiliibacterium pneumoniae]MBE2897016.1 type I secretion system permease/ATPase [Spirabiliibacterium pneumoniae]
MKQIIENLALATQLLGAPLSVATLAAHTVKKTGNSLDFSSLCEFLRSEGYDNSLSERALSDIPSLAMPVILILRNEEAAVVTQVRVDEEGERLYRIAEPGDVQVEVSERQLQEKYIGYCWFIKPKLAQDLRSELPEYTLPKSWFFRIIWRFKKYYYQVILATFLINTLALVSSLYVMNVYDRVIPNQAYETLWVLSIGVFLAIFFEFLAKTLRGHLTDIAGKKADLIISAMLFRRVMSLRLQDRPVSAGSYANNLRDFESVREFLTSASLLTLVDLPFLVLFITVIGLIGGKLALVPGILIPIVICIGIFAQFPLSKAINESMRESSQRQGLAVEAIEGIETLKNNNAALWAQKRWDHFTAKSSFSSIKVKDISNLVINAITGLQQLNTVILVVVGTYLIHSEDPASRITMGALIASVILSGRALAPLGQIASLAIRFQQAWTALKGVDGIVQRPIEKSTEREYISLRQVQGNISFKNVSFQYQQDDAPALSGLNLNVRAGEKVAILGKIGSGKSTALKLAVNLYQPSQGTVTLDNINTQQIDPYFLRNQVLLLEQNPRLFLGTLRENLDIARTDNFASDQTLLYALQRFGLLDLIQSHPRGLDMPLGENGLGLSGGQRQAVALARMMLKNPKVALLDEPTTGLDQYNETVALGAIAQWARNKTLIVVTHRPQVLRIVDRVIVMENGQVTMDGPRDAVLQRLNEQNSKPTAKAVSEKVPTDIEDDNRA